MITVNVLGTEYDISYRTEEEDSYLKNCDGYCDKTSKEIVVTLYEKDNELTNFDVYQKKVLRHEIIHAFMFESGIAENYEHPKQYGQEETMVDWIAIQFPKMIKAFEEVGCLQ